MQYQSPGITNPGVKQFVKDTNETKHLLKAQKRMKWYADKKRIVDRQFPVGDEVFLKLQPYKQSSIVTRRNQKIAANIMDRIILKIHNVFNFFQLKLKIGKKKVVQTELPSIDTEGSFKVLQVAVLDRQLMKTNNKPATMVPVQWTSGGRDEATWEFWEDIHKKFNEFDPWGQVSV